eukprot:1188388-Prorocentrum_minimum.AAC.5
MLSTNPQNKSTWAPSPRVGFTLLLTASVTARDTYTHCDCGKTPRSPAMPGGSRVRNPLVSFHSEVWSVTCDRVLLEWFLVSRSFSARRTEQEG